MKRVLVTGAAGFMGRHLCSALALRGCDVTAAGRTPPHDNAGWQRFVAVDLRDEARVQKLIADTKPDVVFWLAGLLRGTEAELVAHNTTPVEHACKALAAKAKDTRLVLAGSSAEYGPSRPDGGAFDETSVCAPGVAYGKSKWLATKAALAANERHGIDVRIARPSNVLGPGSSRQLLAGSLVAQLAERLSRGEPFAIKAGDLTAQRDFVDVEDVCRGYLALAEYRGPRRVFNFAADQCFPVRTIVDILQHEVAMPIEVERDPTLGHAAAPDRVAITAALAAAELGFRRHVSLRESIARMWRAAVDDLAAASLTEATRTELAS